MTSLLTYLFPMKLAVVKEGGSEGRPTSETRLMYHKGSHRAWRLKRAIDPLSSLPSFHWTRIRNPK